MVAGFKQLLVLKFSEKVDYFASIIKTESKQSSTTSTQSQRARNSIPTQLILCNAVDRLKRVLSDKKITNKKQG